MNIFTVTSARANLYNILDQVSQSHKPVRITGKRVNAVLVSEEDWTAIQETLHLLAIPGMRKSIKEGMAMPLDKCDKDLDW